MLVSCASASDLNVRGGEAIDGGVLLRAWSFMCLCLSLGLMNVDCC